MSKSLPILIIGAGVAGPALACSLHQKGYKVIIFEKYDGPAPGGASLHLAPNGLRVLASVGLAAPLFARHIGVPVEVLSFRTNAGPLVTSDILSVVHKNYGFPFAGVKRNVLLGYLMEAVQARGIDLRFNHSLSSLEKGEDFVSAVFENGQTVKGSFIIGCDGLHSRTRVAIFGNEVAEYTGLTQTAGLTLVPRRIRALQNIYADNVHVVSYAVGVKSLDVPDSGTHGDTTLISWAVTRPEEESKESWKAEAGDTFRKGLVDSLNWEWADGISARELVNGAPAIIKFGLYDRKELKTWHKDRVILIGDAAHPTAPHLGQGANQALEDVFHLTALLETHLPPSTFSDDRSPATDTLRKVFGELEAHRIPRTSALVHGAREMGRQRVLPSGSEDAEERNRKTKEAWSRTDEELQKTYEGLLGTPTAPLPQAATSA